MMIGVTTRDRGRHCHQHHHHPLDSFVLLLRARRVHYGGLASRLVLEDAAGAAGPASAWTVTRLDP
jgi:hypothetical protein